MRKNNSKYREKLVGRTWGTGGKDPTQDAGEPASACSPVGSDWNAGVFYSNAPSKIELSKTNISIILLRILMEQWCSRCRTICTRCTWPPQRPRPPLGAPPLETSLRRTH